MRPGPTHSPSSSSIKGAVSVRSQNLASSFQSVNSGISIFKASLQNLQDLADGHTMSGNVLKAFVIPVQFLKHAETLRSIPAVQLY